MRKSKVARKGFTLIELLIVISIIALLAAILFPVFARARDNARRSTCMSNLKQVGLGMAQYLQDNDGRYPVDLYVNPATGVGPDGQFLAPEWGANLIFWQQMIFPYVKSHALFFCPSSPARSTTQIASDPRTNGLSYMLNANYSYNADIAQSNANMNEAKMPDAAGSFLFVEYGIYYFAQQDLIGTGGGAPNGSSYSPGIGQTGISCSAVFPEFKSDCETGRHFGGVTVAYADGHVKWLSTAKTRAEGVKANGAWKVTVTH